MRKSILAPLLAILVVLLGCFQAASAEVTATITVTTTLDAIADDGQCSLREAIIAANTDSAYHDCPAGSGVDVINFDPGLTLPATFLLTKTDGSAVDDEKGDLDIRQSLTINGLSSANFILDGNLTDRVLEIHPGAGTNQNPVILNGVTVRNGNPGSGADGGGIYVGATARLTINDSLVTANSATACPSYCGGGVKLLGVVTINNSAISNNQGGGLHNSQGILTLNNVQVSDNTSGFGVAVLNGGYLYHTGGSVSNNQGGGIYIKDARAPTLTNLTISGNTLGGGLQNESSALITPSIFTLTNSLVTNNSATSGGGVLNMGGGASATIRNTRLSYNTATSGGGAINNNGTLTLTGSALDHNTARTGGGIDHNGPSVTLTNNTISHNTVSDNGGGVYNRTTLSLLNMTIYGNAAGGADTGGNIYNDGDSLAVKNTVVAGAGAGGNCFSNSGAIVSAGHNLESTDTCGFAGTGDIVNADPLLGPLQDNSGPTHTHALLESSPAINAGDNSGCPATDQRGVSRPQGAACDIGSYELILGPHADLSLTKLDAADPVTVGGNITYNLTVSNNGPNGAQNVILTDNLPGTTAFVSVTPSGSCAHVAGVVTCTLGSLANGGQSLVQIVAATTAPGLLTNTASVASDTSDPNSANNSASQSTTVNPLPSADLSLTKLDTADPVTVGGNITYNLTVSNNGPNSAQNVVLTDNLPGTTAFVSVTPSGSCAHVAGVVTCTIGSLANGGQSLVQIVAATTAPGLLTNNASVASDTSDPNSANNSASQETTVQPLKLFLPLNYRD